MAVKIYKIGTNAIIEGVSSGDGANYEAAYGVDGLVTILNLARNKNDAIIQWTEIEDENGDDFATYNDLKDYLTDGLDPVFATSGADTSTFAKFIEITDNIVKNTPYNIAAPNKIAYVSVFDGATLYQPQPQLIANRLSGTITLTKNITDAIITIITV